MSEIAIIAAVAWDRAIGEKGKIPWHNIEHWKETTRADLRRFRRITLNHPVIMGHRTFESILGRNGEPLKKRQNIVLTRDKTYRSSGQVTIVNSFEEAIREGERLDDHAYIIGGESVYKKGIQIASHMYMTEIKDIFPGADAFFPEVIEEQWEITSREDYENYSFVDYERLLDCEV